MIEVDAGEKTIIDILSKRNVEFKTSGHSKEIGDLRKGDVVIERKRIDDIFSSIKVRRFDSGRIGYYMDDHISNQFDDMLQYPNHILIVSGRYSMLRPEDMPKIPYYYGILAKIVRKGITVFQAETDEMLVTISLAIFETAECLPADFRIVKRNKNPVHGIIHASAPRIPWKVREALLDRFETPLGIALASKEELQEVPKLGGTIANNIWNNFRRNKHGEVKE